MVSIVIPAYNASRWIRETLSSVTGQTERAEIIVVDDGSTDDTAQIIEREFANVQVIRTENRGASHARNTGTAFASGDFIQYLDADDLLAPGKIAKQLSALEESGADVAYGDWQRLVPEADGSFQPGQLVARQMRLAPEIELFGDFWCPPAAYLFRRRIVEKVGEWNPRLPVIQDARFALDCALHGATFTYVPGIMAFYREHGNTSLSRRDPRAFVRDIYRNACEVEKWWLDHGGLSGERRASVVSCYGYVARSSYEIDRELFEKACGEIDRLSPGYIPAAPYHLALASRMVGYQRAEAIASVYRKAKAMVKGRA